MRATPIQILEQGAPRVNHAVVIAEHDDIVLIHLDLGSKRCGVDRHIGPGDFPTIAVEVTEESLRLDETKGIADTIVEFPEFDKWQIHMLQVIGKYTIGLCLTPLDED